jgi:hypothetical protein
VKQDLAKCGLKELLVKIIFRGFEKGFLLFDEMFKSWQAG